MFVWLMFNFYKNELKKKNIKFLLIYIFKIKTVIFEKYILLKWIHFWFTKIKIKKFNLSLIKWFRLFYSDQV